ncbi:MAG TPA: Mur ligase family protein [Patescibacteria group bacterium]|nr:Mur ligase family protein [Patescibacteria group bacterium]
MKQITTLDGASAALEAYWPNTRDKKFRMTLEHMKDLMDYLGNPQDSFKAVHVAGTSGKTSTAYYIAALLQASGKKVGLTVSPHVDYLNERVQIGLEPLPEAMFIKEMNEFMALIEESPLEPTYFDLIYAFPFWVFARQKVEYAVIEVGLGGLLDNTNVMTRSDKVCVLTDIGYDHMSVLGNTLPEIAEQKAGIILLRNAVFCWEQSKEVMDVFRRVARQKQADLHTLSKPVEGDELAALPLFQVRNFNLALEVASYITKRDGLPDLTERDVARAAATHIPARMEICKKGSKTIIIDGAHNAQKLHALMQSVQEKFPGKPIATLVAFARTSTPEGRIEDSMPEIIEPSAFIIATQFIIDRDIPHPSTDPQMITAVCKNAGYTSCQAVADAKEAFAALLKRPEPILVVTGSFFLLNTIRPLLGLKRPL